MISFQNRIFILLLFLLPTQFLFVYSDCVSSINTTPPETSEFSLFQLQSFECSGTDGKTCADRQHSCELSSCFEIDGRIDFTRIIWETRPVNTDTYLLYDYQPAGATILSNFHLSSSKHILRSYLLTSARVSNRTPPLYLQLVTFLC